MPQNIESLTSLQQHKWSHHSPTYKHFWWGNRNYFIKWHLETELMTFVLYLITGIIFSYKTIWHPPTLLHNDIYNIYLIAAISQTEGCSYIHKHTGIYDKKTTCPFTPAHSAPSQSPTRRCLWRISAAHRSAGLSILISLSLCTHSAIMPLPWGVAAV